MNENQNNEQKDNEPQVINNPFANMNRKKDEMETQKKKTKMIIIISIIVVTLLLGYIIIDKINYSINKNKAEPQIKENLEEISQELVEFIEQKNLDSLDVFGKNEIIRVAINDVCSGVYDCKIVDGYQVSEYIKEVFDKEIQLTDVTCEYNDGVLYAYDPNQNRFNFTNHVHDPVNTIPIYTKINSIKKKNGKYILTLNKLYYSPTKSEYITSDPLGINNIFNFVDYDMPSDNGPVLDMSKITTDYENNFEKLKNKGNKYRYTFSKKGKKYYLEKYEDIEIERW